MTFLSAFLRLRLCAALLACAAAAFYAATLLGTLQARETGGPTL